MSRTPDYEVKVGKRVEQGEKAYSTKVGVGFANRAGGINVLLDPGIALTGGEYVQITLWPWKPREERGYQGGGGRREERRDDFSDGGQGAQDDSDNIPF